MLQALVAKGITVVLVTHEPDIAQYAARVLTLKDGKVVSDTRHEPVRAVLEPEVAS